MIYVIWLDVTHVSDPSLADAPAVLRSADAYPPYFAIVARITAKLKMKPVTIMNLDRSERSGRTFASEAFS
jgi:hypothetical protein